MANTEQIPAPKGPSLVVQIGMLAAMTVAALGVGWMSGSYLKGSEVPPPPARLKHDKAEAAPGGEEKGAGAGQMLVELAPITTNLTTPTDMWVRMDATVVFDGPQPPETVEAIHQDMLAFQSWLAAAAEKLAGTQGVTIAAPVTISDNMPTPGHAGLLDILDKAADAVGAVERQSLSRAFGLGFLANALNPKAVFFFLSIFSTVVSAHTPVVVKFGYGLVMATCLIAWFVGVSLFMTTPRMRAGFARMSQWIDRTSGVVFIALGIKLATEKAG